jgi:hypothetical protein
LGPEILDPVDAAVDFVPVDSDDEEDVVEESEDEDDEEVSQSLN